MKQMSNKVTKVPMCTNTMGYAVDLLQPIFEMPAHVSYKYAVCHGCAL